MSTSDHTSHQHPNADDIPDGSSSDTGHEDTASGGVSQGASEQGASDDDDPDDAISNPQQVDVEHGTDAGGKPIDNPSG